MTKLITPYQLQDMVIKTRSDVSGLSATEWPVLAVIISFINSDKLLQDGYYSWPGMKGLKDRSGLSDSAIKRVRKKLTDDGWVTIKSGKGVGDSNKYTVNAQKIVDAYVRSGFKEPVEIVAVPGKVTKDFTKPVKAPLKPTIKNVEEEDEDYPY